MILKRWVQQNIEKINWLFLSKNPNAIELLEKDENKECDRETS
jgi:hypothetical protein